MRLGFVDSHWSQTEIHLQKNSLVDHYRCKVLILWCNVPIEIVNETSWIIGILESLDKSLVIWFASPEAEDVEEDCI